MALDTEEFKRFIVEARLKLTGATNAGIKAELFSVLKEFFKDSNCWTENLTVNILPANAAATYSLVPAEGGTILRLIGVFDPNLIPQPCFMPDFNTLTVVQPQTQGQAWTAIVSKQVVLPTTREGVPDAPDWTFRIYDGTILDGVLGRMMAQENKAYTDDKLSQYHLKRFRDGIAMARVAALRQNTYGAQSWRFPKSAQTHGQRGGISTGYPTAF